MRDRAPEPGAVTIVRVSDRLVYSTGDGALRRTARSGEPPARAEAPPSADGVVRVSREKSGRGGKVVTVVRGLGGDPAAAARDLRRHCGSGGTVRDGAIEIQGDHADRIVARLEADGHRVKRAGG